MSVGTVPDYWLTAYIVLVFKKGTAGDTVNYRPISLTSVPSKILERIVTSKILDHLRTNNILCSAQHGFLKRRSTCTNLLECFNDWTVCVQSRLQTAVVYVDFAKAFDVISHKNCLPGYLLMEYVALYYCGCRTFSPNVHIKPKLGHVFQTLLL